MEIQRGLRPWVRASCLFSRQLMCVAGPHIAWQLPEGQVWSTSHLWPLLVSMYPTLVHCWPAPVPTALAVFCESFWALWPCTLGQNCPFTPSGTSVTLSSCMRPTLDRVQPAPHIYFSPHFNFATFWETFLSTDSSSRSKTCEAEYLPAYFEIKFQSLNPALKDWMDSGAVALLHYVEAD